MSRVIEWIYVGNCIDSFDENGDCVNSYLPWSSVSDFACDVEDCDNIVIDNVKVVYDANTDIHSFYLQKRGVGR